MPASRGRTHSGGGVRPQRGQLPKGKSDPLGETLVAVWDVCSLCSEFAKPRMRSSLSGFRAPTSVQRFSDSQVCLETLKELAVADPRVVAHANGFRVLLAAAIDPASQVGL